MPSMFVNNFQDFISSHAASNCMTREEYTAYFLSEGVMSNIHLMADGSKDWDDFLKKFKKDYKKVFQNTPDFMDWLYSMYKDMAPVKAGEKVEEGDEQSDQMAYGQLERCVDFATMLRERIDNGYTLDPWMYNKIAVAEDYLNTVFGALDGADGEIEQENL